MLLYKYQTVRCCIPISLKCYLLFSPLCSSNISFLFFFTSSSISFPFLFHHILLPFLALIPIFLTGFAVAPFFNHCLFMKTETLWSFETSVHIYPKTQHNVPKDLTFRLQFFNYIYIWICSNTTAVATVKYVCTVAIVIVRLSDVRHAHSLFQS